MKTIQCQFVGSFFQYDQLPRDKRPQVAFAGRSNVGKSSLLNKLVGQKKMAKVSSTPGKTRSLNFFLINEKFYFVDLPGYGYAKVAKSISQTWGKMIESYLQQSRQLAGLVLLLDARRDLTSEDVELISWLAKRGLPVIAVVTKADKCNRDTVNKKVKELETEYGLTAIPFSIVSGVGKKEVLGAVFDLIGMDN